MILQERGRTLVREVDIDLPWMLVERRMEALYLMKARVRAVVEAIMKWINK